MLKRTILWASLLLLVATTCFAYQVRPRKQRVYMFGVGVSFTDSVSYITDLQAVDGYVMPNGFLADRSLYSLQLNNYFVAQGRENMTCVIFFSKKKSAAEKRFQKVRKKYLQDSATVLQSMGIDMFRFESEEWVDTQVTESSPTTTSTQTSNPTK